MFGWSRMNEWLSQTGCHKRLVFHQRKNKHQILISMILEILNQICLIFIKKIHPVTLCINKIFNIGHSLH